MNIHPTNVRLPVKTRSRKKNRTQWLNLYKQPQKTTTKNFTQEIKHSDVIYLLEQICHIDLDRP